MRITVACLLLATSRAKIEAFVSRPTVPKIRLSNGVQMPAILLGTPSCGYDDPSACQYGTTVEVANGLRRGFTGIDTANHYNNQEGVAAAVHAVNNAEPWITSKVEACNSTFVRLGHCYNDTLAVARANLIALGRRTLDLMLLHAPTATGNSSAVYPGPAFGEPPCNCSHPSACSAMQEQWAALETMYAAGELRAIGVSNYCPSCLDCLAKTAHVTPHVNQILLHAGMGNDPEKMISVCAARGIMPQAYSALGSGSSSILSAPLLVAVAAEIGVSTAQVALRWLFQRGIPVIARTGPNQTTYMDEDLALFNWTLTPQQMSKLSGWTMSDPPNPVKSMCIL